MNKTTPERKICPYYKAAILSGHDFTRPLQERELEGAIRKYATCDGVACEHAVIKREREAEIFVRCGRSNR